MAKRKNEIKKFEAPAGVPAHLAGAMEQDNSLSTLKEYRTVPRVKIIQGMTAQDLKDRFGEGSCILRPGDVLFLDKQDSVKLVPIGMYVEYCKWSDLRDNESPAIMDRSFDKTSDIARRAASADLRFETYEGEAGKNNPKTYRYVEHRIFICVVYSDEHPLKGEVLAIDFSRGEFGAGTNFINGCVMRKVPLWSQIWECSPAFRDRGDKKWWGLDMNAPSDDPEDSFIKEDEVDFFQELNSEWQDLIESKRVVVEHDHDEDDDADGKFD